MSPLEKWSAPPPVDLYDDRLRGYASATMFMAIKLGVHADGDTLAALSLSCDRDIYAETVAALGYDPLGDRDERHQPRTT